MNFVLLMHIMGYHKRSHSPDRQTDTEDRILCSGGQSNGVMTRLC